ncbi:TetR/AcrR family transcriptional regulator [Streptomyces sp. NPDC127039]|uniref:TetR/AcrR family transcriptional regulator n=1 Tax=Streptomyces sp. NPDC127039 TaxID=3347115 RepID=UPI003660D2B7
MMTREGSGAHAPTGRLRKEPRQARSRARVEAIFVAATRILDEEGVEALTMRRLAAEARVPSGSLYQFFSDKSAVLTAVARHHMDSFVEAMNRLIEEAGHAPWPQLVDIVFDNYVDLYRRSPGYLAIRTGRHLTPELLLSDAANNDMVAHGVRRILLAQETLADTPDLTVACRAGVHAADAVLQLAFRTDPSGDPALLAQAKRMVSLYLSDYIAEPRHHSPTAATARSGFDSGSSPHNQTTDNAQHGRRTAP